MRVLRVAVQSKLTSAPPPVSQRGGVEFEGRCPLEVKLSDLSSRYGSVWQFLTWIFTFYIRTIEISLGEYNCHCETSFHFPFTKKKVPEQNWRFCRFCQTLAYSLTTNFITPQHRRQCYGLYYYLGLITLSLCLCFNHLGI